MKQLLPAILPQNLMAKHGYAALCLGVIATLSLSACATKPERGGGGKKGDRKQSERTQQSGTFLQPVSALFVSMDADGNKATSRSEAEQGVRAEWASFERSPSAIKFAQWSLKTLGSTDAKPSFMRFDADFNGVISEGEFTGQLINDFERLDKNKDGLLERSEMIIEFAAPEGRRSQGRQEGGREGGRGGKGGGGGGGGNRPTR